MRRWRGSGPEAASATVIPGASRPAQASSNAAAAGFPPLAPEIRDRLERIYDERIREHVHTKW